MNAVPLIWNHTSGNGFEKYLEYEASCRFREFSEIPCGSLADWRKYREELRNTIRLKLGLNYDRSLPLDYREYGKIVCSGYEVRRITYRSSAEMLVTANLYVPEGKGPFPGVINMHGHWKQGKIAERVQARGHVLAREGYVVLVPDAFGAGERGSEPGKFEYHGFTLGASLLNVGETLMGCQIQDNMRGVDLLCSLPFVDSERIGATGASGGGNQTMWLTAMDDRIKAAVPVVSVGTFESYVRARNCMCELLPDGLCFTEESGILALAAPRALKILNGMQDTNPAFAVSEMLRSYDNARKVYQLYDADASLAYQIFDTPHGYWPVMRSTMLGWFDLHLKNAGHGAPRQEPEFTSLPEKDLMVFPEGTPRAPEVLSIASYCRLRGEQLAAGNSRQEREKADRADRIAALSRILRISEPLRVISVRELKPENGWNRFCLELSDHCQLPLAIRPGNDSWILLNHPAGKNAVALPDPDSGASLAVVDLMGQGENRSSTENVSDYHELSRHLLWLGRTLTGEWVRELGAVCEWLHQRFQPATLRLDGTAESAPAMLYASILYPGIQELRLVDAPVSYRFAGTGIPSFYNMALPLPGILAWGDLEAAMELSPARKILVSPRNSDGTPSQPS